MVQEDARLISRFLEAWNRDGVAGIEPLLDPDVEWIDPPELPGAGAHHGREATMQFLREWEGTMGIVNLEFELDEVLECPDGYLVVSTARGAGEGGSPIPPHQWFHWIRLDGGCLLWARLFLNRAAALEATGLSE
jgi:ketosteroid isomerase-like protein